MKQKLHKKKVKNFVAKHAHTFNKAVVMRDRKNDYKRKERTGNGEEE